MNGEQAVSRFIACVSGGRAEQANSLFYDFGGIVSEYSCFPAYQLSINVRGFQPHITAEIIDNGLLIMMPRKVCELVLAGYFLT